MIAINPSTQAFEYLGAPISLSRASGQEERKEGGEVVNDKVIDSLEELMVAFKKWLARNDRLTVQAAFQSQDAHGYGDLTAQKFKDACCRLGIALNESEMEMLRKVLDPEKLNRFNYVAFVRELRGVPQT